MTAQWLRPQRPGDVGVRKDSQEGGCPFGTGSAAAPAVPP